MARKKIREYHAKRLVKRFAPKLFDLPQFQQALVNGSTDWSKLVQDNPWLKDFKLVAKPDMMFGQRGKHNLVLLNATVEEAQAFVEPWFVAGKSVNINGVDGCITHFILEPFVPHEHEFYFSVSALRESTEIFFSSMGGVDIEASWDEVNSLSVPVGESITDGEYAEKFNQLLSKVPEELKKATHAYLTTMMDAFDSLDFLTLETNPFTFIKSADGEWLPLPLDMVVELDDTAKFKNRKQWAELEFPDVFGHKGTAEERFIEDMDEKTGASLKLTVLNPRGRIWNLVAGGGASVIFADTVADLGCGEILGNYGEYSGAPNEEETYHYAKTILDLATRNQQGAGENTALLVGGGIANFTDIAKTFKGIVHAIKEFREQILASQMKIYVRRAGPNYQSGLKLIRNVCESLNIPVEVYGPEKNMTEIIPLAIEYVTGKKPTRASDA